VPWFLGLRSDRSSPFPICSDDICALCEIHRLDSEAPQPSGRTAAIPGEIRGHEKQLRGKHGIKRQNPVVSFVSTGRDCIVEYRRLAVIGCNTKDADRPGVKESISGIRKEIGEYCGDSVEFDRAVSRL
jgi:hypothetical protein